MISPIGLSFLPQTPFRPNAKSIACRKQVALGNHTRHITLPVLAVLRAHQNPVKLSLFELLGIVTARSLIDVCKGQRYCQDKSTNAWGLYSSFNNQPINLWLYSTSSTLLYQGRLESYVRIRLDYQSL